jgi:hypothetical protein
VNTSHTSQAQTGFMPRLRCIQAKRTWEQSGYAVQLVIRRPQILIGMSDQLVHRA